MSPKLYAGLACALVFQPVLASDENPIEFSTELIASYSEADKRIEVDNRFASFRAGGAGVRVNAEHERYGMAYGSLAFGYSPKETASYAGSSLSGPASSVFYGVGYSYQHNLNHRYKLILAADYVSHDISADVTGIARSLPTTATVTSDMSMFDTTLALRYSFTRDIHLTMGAGNRKWDIYALANGIIGDAIGATSEVSADGRDPIAFIGFEYKVKGVPVKTFYRQSKMNADNSLTVHGLDIHVDLASLLD